MIDRKALWISGLIFLLMAAATVWRFSLLPDWRHVPLAGPNDPNSINGLKLVIEPAVMLLAMAVHFSRKFLVAGPEDAASSWRRHGGRLLVALAVIVFALQALMLGRSLGWVSLDHMTVARWGFVALGMLMAAAGNAMPKLPWLSSRLAPRRQLDPWQWNRHARFIGRLNVGLGLVIAAGGLLLPEPAIRPTFLSLVLAYLAASIAYRIKLRREPSALT